MMILTAKVDFKKMLLILMITAAVVLTLVLMLGGKKPAAVNTSLDANEARVKFLQEYGWDVVPNPKESTQIKIPAETGEMFRRYNTLQKGQGYDLSQFAGKKAMRYVYEVKNYPGATQPVYATVLIYKGKVIGGDVTDTSPNGKIRGFQMPAVQPPAPVPQQTQAAEEP